MSDLRRQWAALSLEKQLSVVVVPIAVALVSVLVPLITAGDDPGSRAVTESATTLEATEVSYVKDVGAVCDDMNTAQAARRRGALQLRKRLDRARTTIAQRNALIDDTQSTIDRFTRVFGSFRELGAPERLVRLHRTTAGAWSDSLARLRKYRTLLAGGHTRARLIVILERFSRGSGLIIEAHGVDVRAGLERLGGAECDLDAVKTVRVFTLPRVESKAPDPAPPVPLPRLPKPDPEPPVPTPAPAPPVPTPAPAPPVPTPAPAPPVPTPGADPGDP